MVLVTSILSIWACGIAFNVVYAKFCEPVPVLCSECRTLAYCQTNNITNVIPQNLPPSILGMDILYVGNDSAILSSKMFTRYPNLKFIKLFGRGVSSLEDGIFHNLLYLQNVSIFATNIDTIPDNMFPTNCQIRHLDLHNNRLTSVPYHVFDDLPQLTDLNLGFNNIVTRNCTSIGQQFSKLTKLTKLNLANVTVPSECEAKISAEFFQPISSNVTTFNLTMSNVFTGSRNIFKHFVSLQELDISLAKTFLDCPRMAADLFQNLPTSLKNLVMRRWRTDLAMVTDCMVNSTTLVGLKELPNLNKLDMKYGDLMFGRVLNRSIFSGFHHLTELNIGWARFSTVDEFVFEDCHNLTFVTLDGNPLGARPIRLFSQRRLSKLNHLKLNRAHISSDYSIDYDASQLILDAPLQVLDLRHNYLVTLPFFMSNKTKLADFDGLETIRLDFNYLISLETGGNLTTQCIYLHDLRTLTLSNNQLRKVEGICSSITSLNLAFNELYYYWDVLNQDVIAQLSHLEFLDLSYNQIKSLSPHLFANMNNLTELRFIKNNLTTISANIFSHNFLLEVLDLRANLLNDFNAPIIQHLRNLRKLLLEDNEITDMDPKLISYLDSVSSMKTFGVIGNPLLCRCDQEFFQKWIRTTDKVPYANKLKCYGPTKELKQKKIYEYTRDTYYCDYQETVNTILTVFGSIIGAILVTIPCYKYRWYISHIRVVMRAIISQLYAIKLEHKCVYDAYVMYNSASDEDLNWVVHDLRVAIEQVSTSNNDDDEDINTILHFR